MGLKNFKMRCTVDDNNGDLVCNSTWEEHGKSMVLRRSVRVKIDDAGPRIIDTGDAKEEVLDKIRKGVEKRML